METRLLSAQSPGDLDEAAALLRSGGLVAFPTETVYGLGGLALEPLAVRAIYAAKGRPMTNPLIVHVLGEREARPLCARWPLEAMQLASRFWPGPLTLVLPRTDIVPDEVTGGGPTVAVRAPSHPAARALLDRVGAPLAAPSANRAEPVSPPTAAPPPRDPRGARPPHARGPRPARSQRPHRCGGGRRALPGRDRVDGPRPRRGAAPPLAGRRDSAIGSGGDPRRHRDGSCPASRRRALTGHAAPPLRARGAGPHRS